MKKEVVFVPSVQGSLRMAQITGIGSFPRVVISNWLSSYSTIDFLALWESLYNPNFNRMEYQTVRNESGRLVI